MFKRVTEIFVDESGLADIEVSKDSNDKKLIIMVPSAHVNELSGLISKVEEIEEAQIDLELNSLEDAFIKIAESDIREEEDKNKAAE